MSTKSRGLKPDSVVARERYHVHPRTLKRWDKKPELAFPKPININGRDYRSDAELDDWDEKQKAVQPVGPTAEQQASVAEARRKLAEIRRAERRTGKAAAQVIA